MAQFNWGAVADRDRPVVLQPGDLHVVTDVGTTAGLIGPRFSFGTGFPSIPALGVTYFRTAGTTPTAVDFRLAVPINPNNLNSLANVTTVGTNTTVGNWPRFDSSNDNIFNLRCAPFFQINLVSKTGADATTTFVWTIRAF